MGKENPQTADPAMEEGVECMRATDKKECTLRGTDTLAEENLKAQRALDEAQQRGVDAAKHRLGADGHESSSDIANFFNTLFGDVSDFYSSKFKGTFLEGFDDAATIGTLAGIPLIILGYCMFRRPRVYFGNRDLRGSGVLPIIFG